MMYLRIAFLIIIILSCLSVYYLFGKGTMKKEGFIVEKVVDFNDQGQPKNPLIDEYGNPLIDGYYFAPVIASGKWTTGAMDYKQYTLKSVPYGYVASADKKSIAPKTNVATFTTENNIPEWRELTFAEYSQLPTTPFTGATLPSGFFKIKQAIAQIPANHALLDAAANPNSTYLKYIGATEDIPGYTYNATNTGEFTIPPAGKYKIRLVKEYNANNTPKTIKYVLANIPTKYMLDGNDETYTTLLLRKSMTDSFPEWREWTFDEYSQVLSSPIPNYVYGPGKTGVEVAPPPGKFKINKKQGLDMVDKYEIATLPINHKLLGPESFNPNKTYLSYSGAYQDIPGYTYQYGKQGMSDWTGEFAIVNGALTTQIQDPGTGKYKIRLVTEYNADNTPKTVRFVVATIPVGYALDPADTTFTKLVSNVSKYDANVLPTDAPSAPVTDITAAPTSVTEPPVEGGVYYQYDQTGKLVEVNYKESNFAPVLYYMPGAYKFGSSAFVPTYEDSVYLSRSTRDAQLLPGAEANAGLGGAPINSDAQLGGFCNANENNKAQMEEKCNAMPLDSCASTSCCVLLGGQKCVAGSEKGPYMTANYTDYTIMPRNKDFYYYQGKCYGNCVGRTMSMISSVMPSTTMPSASVSATTP